MGVVIAMLSSAAVNDPDPRQQRLTMLLLPLPATAAVTLGALLAPHKIAGDVVFVAVMFTAVYVRRFGSRGMALGMVAFMAYFFSLFLGATVSMLPWLIAALVIGTACSFVMRTYVLRERPERVLALTLRALRARTGAIVATVRGALAAGELDERSRRRLRGGVARLGETALLAESQLEQADVERLWPALDQDELILRLFDSELAAESLASAAEHADFVPSELTAAGRAGLTEALDALGETLRDRAPRATLERAQRLAGELTADRHVSGAASYRLALATEALVTATARIRAVAE